MPEPTRQKKSILGPGGLVNNPPSIYAKTTEESLKKEEAEVQKQSYEPEQSPQLGEQYSIEQEKLKYMEFDSLQPTTHDRRHTQSYLERKRKVNFLIDERIWPYVNHYLTHGPGLGKGDRLNRLLLETLLAKGYPVAPDILDRPFDDKDVPKPPR